MNIDPQNFTFWVVYLIGAAIVGSVIAVFLRYVFGKEYAIEEWVNLVTAFLLALLWPVSSFIVFPFIGMYIIYQLVVHFVLERAEPKKERRES